MRSCPTRAAQIRAEDRCGGARLSRVSLSSRSSFDLLDPWWRPDRSFDRGEETVSIEARQTLPRLPTAVRSAEPAYPRCRVPVTRDRSIGRQRTREPLRPPGARPLRRGRESIQHTRLNRDLTLARCQSPPRFPTCPAGNDQPSALSDAAARGRLSNERIKNRKSDSHQGARILHPQLVHRLCAAPWVRGASRGVGKAIAEPRTPG